MFSIVARRSGAVRRLTSHGHLNFPPIKNDRFRQYEPGSPERAALAESLARLRAKMDSGEPDEVPCVVHGERVLTGDIYEQRAPSDHGKVVARVHQADAATVRRAIESSLEARDVWSKMSIEDRAAVFLKAGDLIAGKYRADICAATMLGQGKTVWQAEIDAGVEAVDFLRFAPGFADRIYGIQPTEHADGTWNRMEYLPLEGFVFAVAPFNFSAIFVNLPSSPALMGNVCVVKPASTSSLSNYILLQTLEEAGLPPGVINFLPGDGPTMGEVVFNDPRLAGLHFTGSTAVFESLWSQIGSNISKYNAYPRIVGETGGKNAHFVAPSADAEQVATATVRAAFEYQGQKCSACSRMYVPSNLWPQVRDSMVEKISGINQGQPDDMSTFMSAVIDAKSFANCRGYIERAKADPSCEIVAGGGCDDSRGYFVEPTVIVTTDPNYESMREEIFGPILTVYVYDPASVDATAELCDKTSKYGLTGSIFSTDAAETARLRGILRHASGNTYINGPSTGSVVNQQPFGGGRKSGTNDKSGSMLNLLRWVNARTIKYANNPLGSDIGYPHMK